LIIENFNLIVKLGMNVCSGCFLWVDSGGDPS
jgi:hypothetical protein